MATGGQSSSPQPQGPVTSLKDCPHCGSLCLGPRILPCGHLLCRRCLHHELLRRRPFCKLCEEAIHLPGDPDLTLSQLIPQMGSDPVMEQVVLQELERDGDTSCLNCANKKAANVCLNCQDYYCDVCSDNHLKSQFAKDHVLRLLPQALQNTSSTASSPPLPRSPSVLSTLSMDSICNIDDQQSCGVSRDESIDVKEWEKWMKTEVGELQQAYREHDEMDTTLQTMETLVQQLRNIVNTHKQMLDTHQQYLSRLEVIQSADPGSYVVKTRDSDVSMDVKTASLKRRIFNVRKDHACPDINKLKMITGQLTQLLHSAAAEEKSGSSFIHPPKSTTASPTQTSTATQTPPTPDDTPTFNPRVDVMTATPQRVFKTSPTTDQDGKRPWIMAIVCLSDDRLVMTDASNDKVKVMDVKPPHTLSASTHIPERPRYLAVLPDGLVAMTTQKPLIYLMEITNTVQILTQIQTERGYAGIAGHSEGLLIVSCRQTSKAPAAVEVVTRQGQRVRTLTDSSSVVLNSPWYLCPSGDQHILLSDCGQDVVHTIDVCSGQVTQTFHHTHMKGPAQVCADSNGNVFVACVGTECVMVRNRDGQWKQLLTGSQHSDPGETWPRGVCLTRSGHLVVTWEKPRSGDSVVICYKFT